MVSLCNVLALTFCVVSAFTNADDVEVIRSTDYGQVKGFLREVSDSVFVEHFLGIPYAAPPLENFRWQPPQRHPGWHNETLDARYFRSFCPQINVTEDSSIVGDEDCLHLNIYVPRKNYTTDETPLAVFFWVHGGAYTGGYSDFYDSPFSWYSDTVLVTINYRLGALGFMSTGDSHSPGNYGILDMIFALQWVHDNIGYFGGDKDRVTIGGESSGACAVQLIALSEGLKTNTQLFHRVIAHSGSSFSSFALDYNYQQNTKSLIQKLSCPQYSSMLAMECMRKKIASEIIEAAGPLSFRPVKDGEVFTDIPQIIVSSNASRQRLRNRYDYLSGVNSFDSIASYLEVDEIYDTDSFFSFLRNYLSFYFEDADKMADAVFFNYIDWSRGIPEQPDEWKWIAINATRDLDILAPSFNFSNVASSRDGFDSNVYIYLFTPRPSDAIANTRWAYPPNEQYDWVTGNRHAEVLPYVFGVPLATDGATAAEKEVSLHMMRYWGNFIRTGNPNNGSEVATFWPKYDGNSAQYLVLGAKEGDAKNVTRVQNHLESDKVSFWSMEITLYEEGDVIKDSIPPPEANITEPIEPVVNTTTGAIRGLHIQRGKYSVDRFFRVPFAKPPVGILRFQRPQPHPGWEGILDCADTSSAKQWLYICPQRNLRGNGNVGREDCLFLNIWVPGGVNVEKQQPLPVMVWIYGGGFQIGTNIGFTFFYDMERLVTQGTVIGVTMNYRLNSLGFLSTGDQNAPGNMGLLDNVAALQWIQDNIGKFGGDPGKVTIFGESAGGAAVSLHMISPVSKPLFHRGIAESGAVPETWTYSTNPFPQAKSLAEKLGCPIDNTKLLVACLRDKPIKELVAASVGTPWGAVIDGYFLPEDPKYILDASIDKDYIIGHNSMEGHLTMSILFPRLNFSPDRPGSNMDRGDVRRAARLVGSPQHVSEAIAYKFIEWEEPESAYLWPRLAVTYMATEWTFSVGPYVSANVRADSGGPGRTYMYIFGENSRVRIFPYWVQSNHLREMVYTFGHPFEDTTIANRFTDNDRTLSLAMMTHWTNFAWTGNPNLPNKADIVIEWPEYTPDTKYTIFFNTSMLANPEEYLLGNYRGDIMHMWQEILYKMQDLPLTTCPDTSLRASHERRRLTEYNPKNYSQKSTKAAVCSDLPLVRSTSSGCVEGVLYNWQGNTVERYLGIPYAKPATGSLRFANPEPTPAWTGVKQVKEFGKVCPQVPFSSEIMSEDCLHVSVYVPQTNSTDPLAVFLWIHGGRNQIGSGNRYQGDALATLGNIIVAVVNYRVNSLGFLTTDDDAARGNYGLFDQHLAISWVKDNIKNFGGDPNKITIAGQSTGGEDVLYHSLSPMTDSLGISQAIMESPSAIPFGDLKQSESAIALATETSCSEMLDTQTLVECLRALGVAELMDAQSKIGVLFNPTVDGIFLPDHPNNLVTESRVNKWSYLMGANDGDGNVGWSEVQNVVDEAGYHEFVNSQYSVKYGWRTSSIDEQYAHYEIATFFKDAENIQKSLIQLYGDELFIFSTHKLAIDYSNFGSNVYFYYFTCVETPGIGAAPGWNGAQHGAELYYIFGDILNDGNQSDDVKNLSRRMISYWSDFVKTGDPNDSGENNVEWSKYKKLTSDRNYLVLDTGNSTAAKTNLRPTDDAFWNDYLPRQSKYCEKPVEVTKEATSTTAAPNDVESPTVFTANGAIVGQRIKNEHFDIHTFLGIPYAMPPTGDLRFAKTQPVQGWSTALDASTPKAPCSQLQGDIYVGTEDCLYLDIYMPLGVVGTDSKSMPVMIWIHGDSAGDTASLGGGFWSGGGSPGWDEKIETLDPSYLSFFGSVMVIRPNYRLGSLGFLTTEDDVMKGNYGLWDLKSVVEWAAQNVQFFGGDPEKITVFGQGSGAALAEILAVIPSTAGLVKRVISQSGSGFSPWTFCDESKECLATTNELAKSLSCEGDNNRILDCFRSASVEDIVRAAPFIGFESSNPTFNAWGKWRLRKDDDLIPHEDLQTLYSAANFDYMTGTTSHEFYRHLEAVYASTNVNSLEVAISEGSRFLYGLSPWNNETLAFLVHSYTPWDAIDNDEKVQESAVKYYGDLMFAASASKSIEETGSSENSYQYVLMRKLGVSSSLPDWLGGCHGDDIVYLFGYPHVYPSAYSDEDREFSHKVMSHWTNFAWSGNPNTAFSNKNWRKYGTSSNYIELGARRGLPLPTDYNVEKNALWNEVIQIPSDETGVQAPVSPPPSTAVKNNIDDEDCVEEVPPIGQGIGLHLTPEEADTAIYVMFSVCLLLGATLMVTIVVWYTRSRNHQKKFDRFGKVNESFISGGKPNDYLQRKEIVSSL